MQQIARGERAAPLLVLEDDVGLPTDLNAALSELIAALPARWDIVRLSYPTKLVTRPIATLGGGRDLVRYSRVPTTTGAYLISASGARKFLAERPRCVPVDHDLRHVWDWDLDTYGVSPPLIAHEVLGASSIDTLSPNGRASLHRRQREWRATPARLHQGIRDFGFSRWLALGPLNLAARLTPKRLRPSFVRWANARLA
jgi:glycosyl transferase family 25